MTDTGRFSARPDYIETLARAEQVIRWLPDPEPPALEQVSPGPLKVGVDLGTAYLVLVVLDPDGQPLAGEYQFAQVVRDGLVVDYLGAIDRLVEMKKRVEARLGMELTHAASGYPPGVPQVEVRAMANVVEAAGLRCSTMVDEPSAANAVLQLTDGAIVDVGGGTTGIAILENGKVVYTADEATGGTHFSLVVAGAQDISFEADEHITSQFEKEKKDESLGIGAELGISDGLDLSSLDEMLEEEPSVREKIKKTDDSLPEDSGAVIKNEKLSNESVSDVTLDVSGTLNGSGIDLSGFDEMIESEEEQLSDEAFLNKKSGKTVSDLGDTESLSEHKDVPEQNTEISEMPIEAPHIFSRPELVENKADHWPVSHFQTWNSVDALQPQTKQAAKTSEFPQSPSADNQSGNVKYWADLGSFYMGTGMYEQAIDAYQAALELEPNNGRNFGNLAMVHTLKGEYQEAIPLFEQSLELLENNQDKAISWNRLGNVYRRLNNRNKATYAYQKAKMLGTHHASISSRARNILLSNCLFE